jgi:tetratricopeptide (TPR) repeat protein
MKDDEIFLESQGEKFVNLLIEGDEASILEESNKLLNAFPRHKGIIYYMLGGYYMLKKKEEKSPTNYHKAIDVYKELLNISNIDENYKKNSILNMGFAFKELGMRKEAINCIEKSIKSFPDEYENNSELKAKVLSIYNELLKNENTD